MKKKLHISQYELPRNILHNLKGYAFDISNTLISVGLRQQDTAQIMDAEFVSNMGVLCTGLCHLFVCDNENDINWIFSQHGLLYVQSHDDFRIRGRDGVVFNLNYMEFSFVIAMVASQENMLWAIKEGYKNPFRISYFYFNFLEACLNNFPESYIDVDKVLNAIKSLQNPLFLEYSDHLDDLLNIPVTYD